MACIYSVSYTHLDVYKRQILLFLPPDVLEEKQVDTQYISSQLDVIYEDENILIVNKPYG